MTYEPSHHTTSSQLTIILSLNGIVVILHSVFPEKCAHCHISVDPIEGSGSYCLPLLRKILFIQVGSGL